MILISPPIRPDDKWGQGHYGASRGNRTHEGIDYFCPPESVVFANCSGIVSKIGYPYKPDDEKGQTLRYVQITGEDNVDRRFFYVDPSVVVGQRINEGDPIGFVQDVAKYYPGMNNHFHFECKFEGEHIDPRNFL